MVIVFLEYLVVCHVEPETVCRHRGLDYTRCLAAIAILAAVLIVESPVEIPQRTKGNLAIRVTLILMVECTLGVVDLLVENKVIGEEETRCCVNVEYILETGAIGHCILHVS